ncbi:type II toxin-antitoxin system mRNA interferase toxin, RelE/StbE family [Candidatus Fermentibacteria bacterium]|nr:type II toxin-antitoxin system mRNA interferase toxin, RelE/StbE family [Candidatus Fermentibacteria bacterium]
MYRPVYTRQFKKDIKKAKKQGKDIEQFKLIAHTLLSGKPLDPIFRDHQLIGNYKGRRECHVKSDWLLIYKIEEDRLIFERIGSHAELFTN